MIEFVARFDDGGLARAIEKHPEEMGRVLRRSIADLLSAFEARLLERMRSGGDGLRVRTGSMRRSVERVIVGQRGDEVAGAVRVAHPGAKKQETGGTVTPRSGQYLAIPLRRTKAGVSRDASPLDFMSEGDSGGIAGGASRSKRTFVLRSKTNPLDRVVYLRMGQRKAIPIFVLKREVTLRPRLGFFQTWEGMRPLREAYQEQILNAASKLLTQGGA